MYQEFFPVVVRQYAQYVWPPGGLINQLAAHFGNMKVISRGRKLHSNMS